MNLVSLIIAIIIWGLVMYVLWWGLARIGLPEPFNKVATVLLVLLTVVVLLSIFFGGIKLPTFHFT